MKDDDKIFVTWPSLPNLEEFIPYLEDIWKTRRLTNNGIYHQQFEKELADFLGVKYLSLFANGTLALVTALQVLKVTGEVITTPYSFVATTHSLWWNNIKPVFVDIEPNYCNIDPKKIEAAITPKTTAILPVHIYGNPCEVERIKDIADIHGLRIIYDACHAFGITFKETNNSVLNFGDLSVLSFHATKVFTTFEGGAIICHDEQTKNRIDYLKNFGFADETTVVVPGINAKMNEVQSSLGIIQIKYFNSNINKRKIISDIYREKLSNIPGIRLLNESPDINHNYAYFPIFINEEKYGISRDNLYTKLKENNIYCRRYFYPLISEFPAYRELPSARKENLTIAYKISKEVLCLPIYSDLDEKQVERISMIIKAR